LIYITIKRCHQTMVSMEDENFTTLRKRSPVVDRGRPRERSVDPSVRKSVTFKLDTITDEWERFKDGICDKYPSIKFPDEYCETDVISASVTGIDTNLCDVVNSLPSNVKFNVQQDGRVVVEFRKVVEVEHVYPPVKIKLVMPSKNSIIIFIWLLCMVSVAAFIKLNYEKYKKLLWI
jgi:hypothetical protein